ncbi:MAG: MarR family winged helix-turn-helix transcriptional regulator [Thermodesulfobacteriota bacterium]
MAPTTAQIDRFRRFSRFYTALLGLLDDRLLHSPASLAQGRILFEVGVEPDCTARDLGRRLDMDRGQLSRTLSGLERQGWLSRAPHPGDRRARRLRLTPAGRLLLTELERRSRDQVAGILAGLDNEQRERLDRAMADIEDLLSPPAAG